MLPTGALAQPKEKPDPKSADAKGDDGGPSPEARAANKKALELFKDRKYAEALDQFQKAYDLSPSWVILCNIGKMSRYTGDFARSLGSYEKCLRDAGPDVDTAQRGDVEHEIADLSSLVGWASLHGEAGATISADGKDLGALPIDHKIAVNPGSVTFTATKGGRHRDVTITSAAAQTVDVDLALPSGPAHGEMPASHGFRFPDALVVTAWAVTGIFAASAIITGSVAVVDSSELKSTVYVGPATMPPADSALVSKANRIGILSGATDAFIAIAAVSAAAGATFSIFNAVEKGKAGGEKGPTVDVKAGASGVFVTGSF